MASGPSFELVHQEVGLCRKGFTSQGVHMQAPYNLIHASIHTWEFPKIRGTLFRGPYNKDPTI